MSEPRPERAPLRVAHVNSELGFSGGEDQMFLLMRGLREAGHHNLLFCRPGSRSAELAEREFAIAKGALFNHELRFKCDEGVTSRITANLYYSPTSLKTSKLGALDFDHGAQIWGIGYNTSHSSIKKPIGTEHAIAVRVM